MENTDNTATTSTENTQEQVQQVNQEQPVDPKKQEKVNTKLLKEQKKAERMANRNKPKASEEEYKKDPNDISAHLFGDLELNRSQSDPEQRYARTFTAVKDLNDTLNGQEVLVRARLHQSRIKGKLGFIKLREQFATVQSVI
jgi:aspartyl-tRNA synthetase